MAVFFLVTLFAEAGFRILCWVSVGPSSKKSKESLVAARGDLTVTVGVVVVWSAVVVAVVLGGRRPEGERIRNKEC